MNQQWRVLLAAALLVGVLAGCGESEKKAAVPSPSPSVVASVDRWGVEACIYLGRQDPSNGFANDFALTIAGKTADRELADAVVKAKQLRDMNLVRSWCQKYYPRAGVTPVEPSEG